MNRYLPEGMALTGGFTHDRLRRAMETQTVLQAPAVVCTAEHDLLVELGCTMGRIPREEAALGIRDGSTKDIAILSRVGKAVSFTVQALSPGGTALLSRRRAQELARQQLFETKQPGDILPAVVTGLAAFGAFCDVGCGVPALLGLEQISVSRIAHSRDRFREDQQIPVIVKSLSPDTGRIALSHRELLGTWEENAAAFHPGQTVTGIVRSVKPYGAFVELTPNLSGLAEPNFDLHPNDAVSVYIKSILPQRLKLKLVALRKLDPAALPPVQPVYWQQSGRITQWRYGTEQCPKTVSRF